MVRSRQSQGWPVAAMLLCLLFLAGCDQFISTDAPPDHAPVAEAVLKDGYTEDESVTLTVYMNGEAIDTITVPRSLVLPDAESPTSEPGGAVESDEAAAQASVAENDAGEEATGEDDSADEPADEPVAIPEILVERERAIAAQMELNATVDYQMDWLSYTLGQDQYQLPSLSPPPPPANQYPVYLTRDESKWHMEQAVFLSQQGDVKGALDLLLSTQCDLNDYELYNAWTWMKYELAALYFDSIDVAPVSARMTASVLIARPDSTIRVVRDDLRRDWAWAWRYEGRTRVMEALFSQTPDPEGLLPDSLLAIEGYSNVGLPADPLTTDRPLEHYHYAVFLLDAEYLMSYSLQSRELSGTGRIYFLERRLGDDPEVLFVYAYLPDYWTMLSEVRIHLEQVQQ